MSQSMNQENRNESADETRKLSWQNHHIIAAVLIALIVLLVIPVLAWLYYQRSIQTMTLINEPFALEIGAGDAQDIAELKLSNIDVTEADHKDVVFCVFSRYMQTSYHLQLAHTTNIGFKYTIYPAGKSSSGVSGAIEYLKDYYTIGENPVVGKYLNAADTSNRLAKPSGDYHDKTYPVSGGTSGGYTNVQKYAEPLYWKTTDPLTLPTTSDGVGHYIDYYVLRISWDKSIQNNKETDMIYLMAEATEAPSE